MKLNRLETHDRLLDFNKQKDYISKGCQDCIRGRPEEFQNHPFYIFAHVRTHDNGWSKRLIWEPRLTKPKAQTNSMLFKAYPGSDVVKVIWMIPARELWDQYTLGKMMENKTVCDSIHAFQYDREKLEEKEPDDPSDDVVDQIYRDISTQVNSEKRIAKMYESIKE